MRTNLGSIRSQQQAVACMTKGFPTIERGALRADYRSCLSFVDSKTRSENGRRKGEFDFLVGLRTYVGRDDQML